MRTRWLAAASVLMFLSACAAEPGERSASKDMLFLQTEAGIAVAAAGASSAEFQAADSIPSTDWSTVVRSRLRNRYTRVIAVDALSGEEAWRSRIDGALRLKIVSASGDQVALGPANERYYDQGRRSTTITIQDSSGSVRPLKLKGNYEPEAFSTDGQDLFLVQYLPARAPTHYRVRTLDIGTGKVGGVYTVDAELQEAMRGTARVQASSLDGSRLYTLYTLREHGEEHSFIHVLDLDEKWAHCIDLPDGFTDSPEKATSMTVSPDGDRLYVGNSITGTIAELDTEALNVARSSHVTYGLGGPEHMTMNEDHLFIASGRRLSAVSLDSLAEDRSWSLEQKIRGLQAAEDGYRLYVGQRALIAIIDVETGRHLEAVDPPGVDKINLVGRTTPQAPLRGRSNYKCAC